MIRVISILVLASTLLLKGIALMQGAPLLAQPDGVLPFSTQTVLIMALVLELACLTAVFRCRTQDGVAWCLLWFIVPASTYRLAGAFGGAVTCPCLGSLTGWWPWLAVHQTAVLNTVAIWMFLSAVMVLWRRPESRFFVVRAA
jgi:hypothetical protein